MLSTNGLRDADIKSQSSVHPSPPLVRHAENITNERKARDTSVRMDERGSRFKTNPETLSDGGDKKNMFNAICTKNTGESLTCGVE